MAITPEALAEVEKLYQHMQEVEAGLIPEDSPPDFIRSDWQPDENGMPGWFGPAYAPSPEAIRAAEEAQAEATSG